MSTSGAADRSRLTYDLVRSGWETKPMRKQRLLGAFAVVAAVFGIAWAKGDWSAAQSKAEDMKRKQADLRKLVPDEIRRVVTAVCEADEDERRNVGKEVADRVADEVKSELSNLERMRDDAYKAIDEVLADQDLQPNHDSAKRLRDEVSERWKSIEGMAQNAMRGGNHPIVAFMALKGIEEHQNYQHNTSNCHAYEVETGSRRADCLYADGETCYVIELKPKNSGAIVKGNRQAREAQEDLNKELAKGDKSDVMKALISRRSDFAKCKHWEAKLKCYTLGPEVNDEGEYREGSVSWSDC